MSTNAPGLCSLPVELLLEIVELAMYSTKNAQGTLVGSSAAWIEPSFRPLTSQRLPTGDDSTSTTEDTTTDKDPAEPVQKETAMKHHPLKSLRMSCKFLNEICASLLYRNTNLLTAIDNLDTFQRITHFIIIPHWQHIRSLSVFADYKSRSLTFNHEKYIAAILSVCRSLTSLSLYYHHTDTEMTQINPEVLELLERHQLSELGIYSIPVLREPYDQGSEVPPGVIALLDSISSSKPASEALTVLDIVIESMPRTTYDLVRSNLTSLQSLTIRRALRQVLGRIWDPQEHSKWAINFHLTKLQLINCQPAYAPHVPPLVHHFPSLRELMISTCGDDSDILPPSHPRDWSKKPYALCRTRPPLDIFHVEHMEDWEIMALGIIPTKVLIVTTVKRHHLLRCLKEDPNLFPGLKVLRIAPRKVEDPTGEEPSEAPSKPPSSEPISLEDICKARQIELRRDAEATWHCLCCGIEGY